MIHKQRTWYLVDATPETIADLPNHHLVGCAGYRLEHEGQTYLLLNDGFAGGVNEFAVCRLHGQYGDVAMVTQHESVTIGWCTPERVRSELPRWLTYWREQEAAGLRYTPFFVTVEPLAAHGRRAGKYCGECA